MRAYEPGGLARSDVAVAHVRNDDPIRLSLTASSPCALKLWACGWELYRVDWFQTASSIEACSDHVLCLTNDHGILRDGQG